MLVGRESYETIMAAFCSLRTLSVADCFLFVSILPVVLLPQQNSFLILNTYNTKTLKPVT